MKRLWLTAGICGVLIGLAVLVVLDVTQPYIKGQISSDVWLLLFGLNIVFGAAIGWFCRPIALLIVLSLTLSYITPYGIYYLPVAITQPHRLPEYRSWAPAFVPNMFLYGSPAVWIAAGIAHYGRRRYRPASK